jgi:predicted negative regulator of RcsB-dependent stress response
VFKRNGVGELILDSNGNNRIENYRRYLPDPNTETLIAILLIILGAAIVLGLQWYGKHQKKTA